MRNFIVGFGLITAAVVIAGISSSVNAEGCAPSGCVPTSNPGQNGSGSQSNVTSTSNENQQGNNQTFGVAAPFNNINNYIEGGGKVSVTEAGCTVPVTQNNLGIGANLGTASLSDKVSTSETQAFGAGVNYNRTWFGSTAFNRVCQEYQTVLLGAKKGGISANFAKLCADSVRSGDNIIIAQMQGQLLQDMISLCGTQYPKIRFAVVPPAAPPVIPPAAVPPVVVPQVPEVKIPLPPKVVEPPVTKTPVNGGG